MPAEMIQQRHWKAPDKIAVVKDPAFAYRFVVKDDVQRRQAEGWEIVNESRLKNPENGQVEKAQHYRLLILMRMPKYMAEERNLYYRDLHNRRLRALARGGAMAASHNAGELGGTIGKGLTIEEGSVSDSGLIRRNTTHIPISAHPDDIAADKAITESMQKEKDAPEGEGGGTKPSARSKSRNRR